MSRAAGLVVVLGLGLAGCGYALAGRGSALPGYIETIAVPLFGNETPFFEIEQELTKQMRSEFIGRGKYRIVAVATDAEAVLEGAVTSIEIAPASFTEEQQASRYTITMRARIVFRDLKANEVIWQNQSLIFREEYDVATGGDALDPRAFFDQETNAIERVAEDFSSTVVSSILEAF